MDIACGQGNGSRQLKEHGFEVVGVDYDQQYIATARKRFWNIPGLSYQCADAITYSDPEAYDGIISMHTLEHLSQPEKFLDYCSRNIRKTGQLFLEVPLLLPRPLGEPLYPFHDKEYTIQELNHMCEQAGFQVDQKIGRDRGVYTTFESAREAVQYHCSLR